MILKRFFFAGLVSFLAFMLPWVWVFVLAFLGIAVFAWFLEVFIVVFVITLLWGIPLWILFLSTGMAVIFVEFLKAKTRTDNNFVFATLVFSGLVFFAALFTAVMSAFFA